MIDTTPLFQPIACAFALGLCIGAIVGLVAGWAITIAREKNDVWH